MNLRKIVSLVHLWLGLPLALYAVLIGLSGAVLVFHEDINVLLHPHLHPGGDPVFQADPDQALRDMAAQYPGWLPLSITWPHDQSPYWMVYLIQGAESLEVYIDTSTGKIAGTHDPHSGWLGWVERLHNNLRLGRNGRLANGYFAIALILLSLSGAVLVWPRLPSLSLRDIRQWHYSLGTLSFFFLIGLAFTGAYYTWTGTYINAVKAILGRGREVTLPKLEGQPSLLPVWKLMDLAQRANPGKAIHRFPIPDSKYPLRVTFRDSSFTAFHEVTSVTLDPRTGTVLAIQSPAQRHPGDTFLGWLSAFHFGVFGGRPVQIVWALMGLAIAALGPSGVWIWWRKRTLRP